MSEDYLHYKRILSDCLKNLMGWKNNIDLPQKERKRKDANDKQSIQSLRYWYRSYINGLRLLEWIK